MSRLDKFEEILKSYEGREYDSLALFKEYISSDACKIYDSLSPELQKKILKYFDCVRQTGIIPWEGTFGKTEERVEANPEYFDNYLLIVRDLTITQLAELPDNLDKILQLYETEVK